MAATQEQMQLLSVLEDTANLLRKTQINLKKCPKSRLTKGYIEARILIIDDYWKSFKEAHQQLVKITPKEQKGTIPYFLNEDFFIYEDLYNVLQGDLKDMIVQTTSQLASEPNSANTSLNVTQSVVHLPKIQLPTFGGNYEDWPAFQDLFLSLVHNNTSLSDVQKIHYLKSSIKGEAETLLKHVQVTACNYLHAWNILKTRYGNKRLILNCTMKRLFNQRKSNAPSAVQLKLLVDTTTECLNTLENLDINTGSWDPIIIYLLVQKLDPETHKSWEEHAYKDEADNLPTWIEFKKYLESRFRTLELITNNSTREIKSVKERSFHIAAAAPITKVKVCVMCKDNHTLCHCKEFVKMEPSERSEFVKTNSLCFNCLVPGHSALKCKLPVSCRICQRRHHSLLHANKVEEPTETTSSIQPSVLTHVVEEEQIEVNTMIASHLSAKQNTALLATAVVQATNEQGYTVPLRALVDPGSEAAFISEKAAQLLKLERQPVKGTAMGVGGTKTTFKHVVQLNIKSQWDTNFSMPIQAYVMSKHLTTKIPAETINSITWSHIKGLNLADPNYHTPGYIDMLLGVKEYVKIIQEGLVKGPIGTPIAQNTSLGWILLGDSDTKCQKNIFIVTHQQVDVEEMLKTLWEIDTETKRHLTKNEQLCEEIYEKTTTRNKEGRYIVKLPFKTDDPKSPEGRTRDIAAQRFQHLERKFKRTPDLKTEYTKVFNEYIEKGYIEKIPEKEKEKKKCVYLPHHAVVRQDKESSRTRIVFDASCKGVNNISLNDELHVGPQLQEDLRNLLIRWRMKPVCFVADIQKMFFQVFVTKDDSDYQRVLWRTSDSEDLDEYRLVRVTFGTASAPYLAVKTLQRVANDEGNDKTLAVKTIYEDFYMDDMLSGTDTVEDAISLARDIMDILRKGGFELTKWSSNNVQFMKAIEENKRSPNAHVDLNLNGTVKTLGITWNLSTDQFEYKLTFPDVANSITKRSILSDLQKLFDPLGWISPSIVLAKILIQKLWLRKVTWDQELECELAVEWRHIRSDLEYVNEIHTERWLGTSTTNNESIQIHGFSDASIHAYAAVVYCRTKNEDNSCTTSIVAAKTRVAPLKSISLPRLELCGALLLSKLLKQVSKAMKMTSSQVFAWTDSSIVLAWLFGEPSRWKPFIANRVVEITSNVNSSQWYHVQSQDNPADIASRGMFLKDLKKSELWWKGPKWLSENEIIYTRPNIISTDLESKKSTLQSLIIYNTVEEKDNRLTDQFENFDTLKELIRTISYCKRFLNYKSKGMKEVIRENLTTKELEEALYNCIKIVQEQEFAEEIERLKIKKEVKGTSKIKTLSPYLDERGLLRVGGRLRHADLEYNSKHPIILGKNNHVTRLIVADSHTKTLHGGLQLTLSHLRSKYWILKAKGMVKKYIHRCFICAKHNARARTQVMGDLPRVRVMPARPFSNSGVDFTGPFQVLMNKGRGSKTNKAYIAIFICMAIKAIHLELVGDLTSEAFIGAFKRFCARRGKCAHLWSDQGRNFIGANRELTDAWKEASLQFNGEIADYLANDGTQWHFIPAYSPNFGGLWEAGVKSIKYHLKRILTTHLTFEEMSTVLCEIEACLNSRPLCPIDDSQENIQPLTPGHFLIGEAPTTVPCSDLKYTKITHLTRWQYCQRLLQDFWQRWQTEYLSRLQQRPKWIKKKEEFVEGDIVLIKQDNMPPGKWALGRIIDKHPGSDGYTRVYSVKSGDTITKRSISKLCALPIENND